MGRILSFTTSVLIGFGVAGCSHSPQTFIPEGKSCNLVLDEIEVELPSSPGGDRAVYHSALDAAFAKLDAPMLFLSGGSQHGAFGAGYLDQWHDKYGGLPKFKLVTGVSAGALQSTAAFIGDTDMLIETAEITSERQLLDAFVGGSDIRDGFGLSAISSLAQQGAIADLVPLRARMVEQLTDEVLEKVAEGQTEGRKLFIGVTDFDTGRAVAVDMTELATRYINNKESQAHLKLCYHEALIASSIVPIAAKPVFIDGRMYIDGGMRFAVFSDDIRKRIIEAGMPTISGTAEPLVNIVLNGDGEPSTRCGRADPSHCIDQRTVAQGMDHMPHEDWSIVTLGMRSVDLLVNQVARLSVDRVATWDGRESGAVAFVKINEAAKDVHSLHPAELDPELVPDYVSGPQPCKTWREIDEREDDPVEFHPRYMHCLVSYGRSLADERFSDK